MFDKFTDRARKHEPGSGRGSWSWPDGHLLLASSKREGIAVVQALAKLEVSYDEAWQP